MSRTGGVEIKICGLCRAADIRAAVEAGADYLGFVFAESPRGVRPERVPELAGDAVPPRVGVFVDAGPEEVRRAARAAGLRVAQLHGAEPPELCDELRAGGLTVWKALRPRDAKELAGDAARYAGHVDAFLVEGYSPDAAGGTGTSFPHGWLEVLRRPETGGDVRPRLVLAGGLDPENVAAAVREAAPDVVDVSTGVERAPGEKDAGMLRRFVRRAREAARGPRDAGREPRGGEQGAA